LSSQPPLPPQRLSIIQKIFSCLVKVSPSANTNSTRNSTTPTITIQEFLDSYDPSSHPAVVSGRVTITQVLQGIVFDMLGEECFEQFGSYENVLNFILSFEQFEDHYRALSSVIFSDEYFMILIRSTWNRFEKDLPKSRVALVAQYSNRIDTADFETVMKSQGKKK
jgi:hypothetical protein